MTVIKVRSSLELFTTDSTAIVLLLYLSVVLFLSDAVSAVANATIHFLFVVAVVFSVSQDLFSVFS